MATTLKFKWGEVINRSRWSDVFVKHIARFCAQKTGIAKRASTGGELAFLGRGKGLGFREHHYSFTVQRATLHSNLPRARRREKRTHDVASACIRCQPFSV